MRCVWLGLCVALFGCGERPLEPRDPTPGYPHFRVATFNVEDGRHGDESTVAAIGKTGADLICLQEVTYDWEAVLREQYADSYPFMLFRSSGGAGGLGVLSRFPLEEVSYLSSANGWHPAWQLAADTPMGRVQILNLHLRALFSGEGNPIESVMATGEDHHVEISGYHGQIEQDPPTLVMGDFNEDTDGDAVRYLESLGYTNALPLYRPGQYTWRHGSVGNQLTKTIDHIMFDHNFEPLNAWVVNQGKSDHIPVVAHVEPASWPRVLVPQASAAQREPTARSANVTGTW